MRGVLLLFPIQSYAIASESGISLKRMVHTSNPHVEDIGRPPIGLNCNDVSPLPSNVLGSDVVNIAIVNSAELTRLEVVKFLYQITILFFYIALKVNDMRTIILHSSRNVATFLYSLTRRRCWCWRRRR